MRLGGGSNEPAVLIALTLSAFLAFMSKPSERSALISMLQSLKPNVTVRQIECPSLSTDEAANPGW